MDKADKERRVTGAHALVEALRSKASIERIFIQNGISSDAVVEIRRLAKEQDLPVRYVPAEKIVELSGNDPKSRGIVAFLSAIEYRNLEELLEEVASSDEVPLLVMLDQITDVRNFGGIARTAECMGAHGIIIPLNQSAPINADAIRASSGALMHIPVCREKNFKDTLTLFQQVGIKILACTEDGSKNIYDENLEEPLCLMFGSEGEGINPALLRLADTTVRIPMFGNIESLNVGVAVGMCLYEARKQRS